MTLSANSPQAEDQPGIASAEDGLVVLDGPNGVAVTMTPAAAAQTGHNLISAAQTAEEQIADRSQRDV